MKKKLQIRDISKMAFYRFVRVIVPQSVVILPIVITYAKEIQEFLPLWVIPSLVALASIATATDKFIRELKKI